MCKWQFLIDKPLRPSRKRTCSPHHHPLFGETRADASPLGFWQDSGSKLPTFDQPQLRQLFGGVDMPHVAEIQPIHITFRCIHVNPFASIYVYMIWFCLINWTAKVHHYLHEMILFVGDTFPPWDKLVDDHSPSFAHHPDFMVTSRCHRYMSYRAINLWIFIEASILVD